MAGHRPNSILQRVRELVATLDGEFTVNDVTDALRARLKRHAVSTAMSGLVKEGVVKVVRRESRAPRRAYFKYVCQERD